MTAVTLQRPLFRRDFGPLSLVLPEDPDPQPGVDWDALWVTGQGHEHNDWLCRLNPIPSAPGCMPHSWGSTNPAEQGGSGVGFGYSQPDLQAVRVWAKAMDNTPTKPDWGHLLRRLMPYMAGFEMTHEPYFARQIVKCSAYVDELFPLDGPITEVVNGALFPSSLANLKAYAQAHPHTGLPKTDLRCLGQAAYTKAMEHKCSRVLGAPVNTAWMEALVEILTLVAIEETGQLSRDTDANIDQPDIVYSFHQGFALMGLLACCKRLNKPVPSCAVQWMNALGALPSMIIYGHPSVPAFTYSQGGQLHSATGARQGGDPGCGYWSAVCVALHKLQPSACWLERASQYGPQTWAPGQGEQSRLDSMLVRGARM